VTSPAIPSQETVSFATFSCGLTGVHGLTLKCHSDNRGTFTEFYRAEWFPGYKPVEQYQLLTFRSNVMRGMKVHAIHHDYFCPVFGRFVLGLKDMRLMSDTYNRTATIVMDSSSPVLLHVPPGIAHGFYSENHCSLLTGVSHYWNTEDELSISWNDPDIGIDWGITSPPILSKSDVDCLPYRQVEQSLNSLMK
jgi:dTDP-4-dehydrorhamnose 3,5-epimerase